MTVLCAAAAFGGTLSGSVTDTNGAPIVSVWIDAYTPAGAWVDSGLTDTGGVYAIPALPDDTYYVRTYTYPAVYQDEWFDNLPVSGWTIPAGATPIPVSSTGVSNVSFDLAPGPPSGAITGRIFSVYGPALSNVWVDAYRAAGGLQGSGLTDAEGSYTIQRIPEGDWYVRTDAAGMNVVNEWYDDIPVLGDDIPANAQPITVVAGAVAGPATFVLSPGATLSGRVRDDAGAGLSNVWVDLHLETGDRIDSRITSSNGLYAFTGLPAGTYGARTYVGALNYADEWFDNVPVIGFDIPAGAARLALVPPAAAANVDFDLTVGGSIHGTLTHSAGAPIVTASVNLYAEDGGWVAGRQTGASGDYLISGLAAGTYYLCTDADELGYADEWYDNIPVRGTRRPDLAAGLSVSAGQVLGPLHFELHPGGAIAGTVADTHGGAVTGIWVSAYAGDGTWWRAGLTDSNGAYRLQGLAAPGPYHVVTEASDLNLTDEWYQNVPASGSGVPQAAAAVYVTGGETAAGIDFVLAEGGVLSGTISDTESNPLAFVGVGIYTDDGLRRHGTLSRADGAYSVKGVPAGVYFARTEIDPRNYVDEWYDDVPVAGPGVASAAYPLVVQPGSVSTGLHFVLQSGAGLAGSVADGPGNLLAGIAVDVYNAETNWLRSGVTTTGGTYVVQGLSTQGLLYARTYSAPANLVDEWYDDLPVSGEAVAPGAQGLDPAAGVVAGGIDFVLGDAGALRGLVTDSAGSSITGINVAVYTADGRWAAGATTSTGGAYGITRITPGSCFIRTFSGAHGFVDEWHDNAEPAAGETVPAQASAVALAAGQTNWVDFALGFMLMAVERTPEGKPRILWQAASGTVYRVMTSTNLALSAWIPAPTGTNAWEQGLQLAPAQGLLDYSEPADTAQPVFYRIDIEP